jgi:ElaA protein
VIDWSLKTFDDLSTDELYRILVLRQRVFVVEQKCPYQDADGSDPRAAHLMGHDSDGNLVAYLRIFGKGVKYPECSLGRIVTAPEARRTGAGKELMREGLRALEQLHGKVPIRIGAQLYLEKFYREFGFERVGENYLEDDIPHVEMLRG